MLGRALALAGWLAGWLSWLGLHKSQARPQVGYVPSGFPISILGDMMALIGRLLRCAWAVFSLWP